MCVCVLSVCVCVVCGVLPSTWESQLKRGSACCCGWFCMYALIGQQAANAAAAATAAARVACCMLRLHKDFDCKCNLSTLRWSDTIWLQFRLTWPKMQGASSLDLQGVYVCVWVCFLQFLVFVLKLKCSLCACNVSPVPAFSPHHILASSSISFATPLRSCCRAAASRDAPCAAYPAADTAAAGSEFSSPFISSHSLSAASLSYVRQRVLIKRSTAGYQRSSSGRAAFCVSLSASLPPSLSFSPSFFPSLSPSLCACVCALLCSLHYWMTLISMLQFLYCA